MMTGAYNFRLMPGIVCLMLTLPLLSGCIAENTDDCFEGIPLRVNPPADVPPETIKDISLYVFDNNDLLLDILPVNGTEPVNLNYPDIPEFHCAAVCNVSDGSTLTASLKKGDPRSEGFTALKPLTPTRAERTLFTSPADLLYGELNVENNTTSNHPEERYLKVSRATASLNITLRGLQRLTGEDDDDYSLVIGQTDSRLDLYGKYGGDPASYSPALKPAANKDFEVSMLRLFPTEGGAGLTIDIYHHRKLLKSVSSDGGGNPIVPVVGKTANLLLNFEGSVDVQLEVTDWGKTVIWKEYN